MSSAKGAARRGPAQPAAKEFAMASRGLGVFPPLAAAALLVLLTSCTPGGDAMAVKISPYGTAPDGTKCSLYTLSLIHI